MIPSGCCSNNDGIDRLAVNAFLWLAEKAQQKNASAPAFRIAGINAWGYSTAMANLKVALQQRNMTNSRFKPAVTWSTVTPAQFLANATVRNETDIYWIDTYTSYSDQQIDAILTWFKTGRRGLVVAGHIWYQSYFNPNYDIYAEYSVNRILWPLGLMITPSADNGPAAAPSITAPPLHWMLYNNWYTTKLMSDAKANYSTWPVISTLDDLIFQNFAFMLKWLPARKTKFPNVTTMAGASVPGSDPYAGLWSTLNAARPNRTFPIPGPRPSHIIDVLDMSALIWGVRNLNVVGLKASPYASIIPGLDGTDASRTNVVLTITCNYSGIEWQRLYAAADSDLWRSTGLFAAPGQVVTVTTANASAIGAGLRIQVGSHTDDLWGAGKPEWKRLPVVVGSTPLAANGTQLGSPVGGLIYVRVPIGKQLGNVQFTFYNVLRAPYFKANSTTVAAWNATVRNYSAPWAELETSKFIITVPSIAIRNLTDPLPLLNFWNQVLDGFADIANMTRDRARAERIVVDEDISAGWLHSGYPIMAYNVPRLWQELLDEPYLRKYGAWGPFHELGHNHQWANMELGDQTAEASVNVFSAWAMLNVVNPTTGGYGAIRWEHYNEVADISKRRNAIAAYMNCTNRGCYGPSNWGTNWSVWNALITFLQLQEGFGWGFYSRMYGAYRAMGSGYITDYWTRVQLYIVTASQVAGRNLVPFFTTWGFPITDATRAAVSGLPQWAENPVKGITFKNATTMTAGHHHHHHRHLLMGAPLLRGVGEH
ncbi:hypothetical protein HYH02_008872 [Chlamydomonas schloesseri]|uniref:Peptidase M60 domain-containing protein n=1 Tax=Chlamydomonas schloesseri TaxID=2026947 RepID=A0A835WCS5_9CHLO|nr:hypothetical protein HYH02_008872 [Chlamydomonas schloesseri]|eukprot:KAG2445002.1 hypothetical protein HYH02_008872 [Chlamydomonas schloesseri]